MTDAPLLLPMPRQLERMDSVGCAANEVPVERVADVHGPQSYRIEIGADGITITASTPAGFYYAKQTLAQLREQYPDHLPALHITDWPDFPARGVMLDISRDKVPTMQTLFALVDQLAAWKVNQLQLYTEHTFAYRDHRTVWAEASPMTAEEMRALDAYCRECFIELVPNQNSFGHMERWLWHAEYRDLAEAPDGFTLPWGEIRVPYPYSLNPTDPRSLQLIASMYAELLPNFTSRLFNVGMDETFDLGQGRSKDEVARLGSTTRVYLEFLKKVHALVTQHGRTMMFWGDIIVHQPELIPELPRPIIAMEWGYEATSPFDRDGALFAKAGIPFYVCPGTSSWCTIAGRTDNCVANLRNAAENGLKHGAIGFLNTDWGDHGHLQYLPVSFLGFAFGAAYSWCYDANRELSIEPVLNRHVFRDRAGVMGQVAIDLGNVYQHCGKIMGNCSVLFRILIGMNRRDPSEGLTRDDLLRATQAIDAAIAPIERTAMDRADAKLIQDEFRNAAAMLKLACRRGLALIECRSLAANEVAPVVEEHRRLWLARNREGGLRESVARLVSGTTRPTS